MICRKLTLIAVVAGVFFSTNNASAQELLNSKSPQVQSAEERQEKLTPDWLKGQGAQFDELDRVSSLYVARVDDAFMAKLSELPGLRNLNLSVVNQVTLDGLRELQRCKSLEKLTISGRGRPEQPDAHWTADEALEVIGKLEMLTELVADNCGITDTGLSHLESLTRLRVLSLRQNAISNAGMKSIAQLTHLKSLDLGCHIRSPVYGKNNITNDGVKQLAALQELEFLGLEGNDVSMLPINSSKLQGLSLGSAFNRGVVTDETLKHLERYSGLKSLTITSSRVTDEGMSSIAKLTELVGLQLECSGGITEAGLEKLVGLPLTHLTLRGPELSDRGVAHLARLKSLQYLMIFGGTGQTSVEAYKQLRDLQQLKQLSFFGFSGQGSRTGFSTLKQLRTLSFDGFSAFDGWTQADLDTLGEEMPETRITVFGSGPTPYMPRNQR